MRMGSINRIMSGWYTGAHWMLGDSIKKAFAGIPTMLQEMGLESTPENERAVRILGYNRMEITEESIAQIKDWDAEVNTLIDRMKPATVLGMIRDGINPLEHTVTELNEMLANRGMTAAQEEESYSKFLWRLDKTNGITAEERQSYIGILSSVASSAERRSCGGWCGGSIRSADGSV